MVTAMSAATMATAVAVVAAKTMAATAMEGGTDNSQQKVAAEETSVAVAAGTTETATAMEMALVTVTKTMSMPTTGHQQQQQGQCIVQVPCSKRLHFCLSLPPPSTTAADAYRYVSGNGDNDNGDSDIGGNVDDNKYIGSSGRVESKDNGSDSNGRGHRQKKWQQQR
jgi:hypothetical protein